MKRSLIVGLWAVALAAGLVRCLVLYRHDVLYQQASLQNYIVVGLGVAAILVTVGAVTNNNNMSWTELIGGLVASTAVGALLLGFMTHYAPTDEPGLAAPACPGALVHRAHARGQTLGDLNARGGAGSDHSPKDRFPSGCTLGFDGFCIGEPIYTSKGTGVPDDRWLIVHQKNEVVAAAFVGLQDSVTRLGPKPDSECKRFDGAVGFGRLNWRAITNGNSTTLTALSPQRVGATNSSPGTILFGFAVGYRKSDAYGGYRYANVGAYTPVPGLTGLSGVDSKFEIGASGQYSTSKPVTVEAVGESCYADDAPVVGTATFKTLVVYKGVVVEARPMPRRPPDSPRLIAEGCSIR